MEFLHNVLVSLEDSLHSRKSGKNFYMFQSKQTTVWTSNDVELTKLMSNTTNGRVPNMQTSCKEISQLKGASWAYQLEMDLMHR